MNLTLKRYSCTLVTDKRTFSQEQEAYNEDDALTKVRVWMFPHEKLESYNILLAGGTNKLKFSDMHSLRNKQIKVLEPFTAGEHSIESIFKALAKATLNEGVTIFNISDGVIEIGHPYDA